MKKRIIKLDLDDYVLRHRYEAASVRQIRAVNKINEIIDAMNELPEVKKPLWQRIMEWFKTGPGPTSLGFGD